MIAPGDPEYDEARAVFYGGIDKRPAAIVRVASDADVARVIAEARDTGLELAVRSGGHSVAGHSITEGGIVLDLSEMKALEIDPEHRTAWAESGVTAGEYSTPPPSTVWRPGSATHPPWGSAASRSGAASASSCGSSGSRSTRSWPRTS